MLEAQQSPIALEVDQPWHQSSKYWQDQPVSEWGLEELQSVYQGCDSRVEPEEASNKAQEGRSLKVVLLGGAGLSVLVPELEVLDHSKEEHRHHIGWGEVGSLRNTIGWVIADDLANSIEQITKRLHKADQLLADPDDQKVDWDARTDDYFEHELEEEQWAAERYQHIEHDDEPKHLSILDKRTINISCKSRNEDNEEYHINQWKHSCWAKDLTSMRQILGGKPKYHLVVDLWGLVKEHIEAEHPQIEKYVAGSSPYRELFFE